MKARDALIAWTARERRGEAMKYHWINLFNMVESDGGPFDSIEAAKEHAVRTFVAIDNGTALHIGIGNDEGPVCEGSIRDGKWIDGKPELMDGVVRFATQCRTLRFHGIGVLCMFGRSLDR